MQNNPDRNVKQDLLYKYNPEQVVFPGWKVVSGYENENPLYNYLLKLKKGQILPYNKIYSKATMKDLKTHILEEQLVLVILQLALLKVVMVKY